MASADQRRAKNRHGSNRRQSIVKRLIPRGMFRHKVPGDGVNQAARENGKKKIGDGGAGHTGCNYEHSLRLASPMPIQKSEDFSDYILHKEDREKRLRLIEFEKRPADTQIRKAAGFLFEQNPGKHFPSDENGSALAHWSRASTQEQQRAARLNAATRVPCRIPQVGCT